MSFAIIIPAQEVNKYHRLGDLAPFGDATLLEWKIWQCKEFLCEGQVYISSEGRIIEKLAKKEGVNFIKRPENLSYSEMILHALHHIPSHIENLIIANPTSPFMGPELKLCLQHQKTANGLPLVSVKRLQEYAIYQHKPLNFSELIPRQKIEPIYVLTNGCYIINCSQAKATNSLNLSQAKHFEIDSLAGMEIKDVTDYSIAKDLISIYFRKNLDG